MQGSAIVYVATSREFVGEAFASASSVRRWMPEISIYLQVAPGIEVTSVERPAFTTIRVFDNPQWGYIDKAKFLDGVNEERVLFLDGDTYIADALWDGFGLLQRFDLAAAHAPARIGADLSAYGVPSSFPEFNTGVIFCRNTPEVRGLFAEWLRLNALLQEQVVHDQPAFRLAVWQSDLRVATLTPEYNARLVFPTFLAGVVKIFHVRHAHIAAVVETVNADLGMRVFRPAELGSQQVADE